MLFLREGNLEFIREILTGSQAITEALTGCIVSATSRLDLDQDLAEGLKKECGISSEEEATPIAYQGMQIPSSQIAAMMRPALERLLTEIQRSFDYHREQFGPAPLEGVTLSGGGALLKNLIPFLGEGLGMKVEKLDPLRGLRLAPGISPSVLQELSPHLATAVGLSIQPSPQVDLMPAKFKWERKMRGLRVLLKAAAVSALLSVAFFFLLAQVQTYYFRSALAGRTIELSNLRPLVEEWERMAGTREAAVRKMEVYQQLVLQEPMIYGILKEISRLTPRDVQLTEISYSKGRLRLKGLAFSSQGPERVLTQYMGGMASSPFFQEVDLYSAKEAGGYTMRASQFELGLMLK
jgi:Tfp pilus assembly protein PilN